MVPEAHAKIGTRKTRNASNAVAATSDAGESRRRERRTPTTHERERHVSDLQRRRDGERSERRSTGPGAHAEMGTRETLNVSNAVVATSEAMEGRRRGRRAPTTCQRERRASDLGRRRDNERRKRRRTAPEAHARMETRETRNVSNAVVAESDAGKSRRRERRTPTTRERERRASDLQRRCDDERSERRSTERERREKQQCRRGAKRREGGPMAREARADDT